MTKPPLIIPSLADIAALPRNGYVVASTFSGCGGSSLGYRMAGFRVGYANEFVEEARNTYRANCSPETSIDGRDIRQVTAGDILAKLGMQAGELDLLDGSPPCSAFSTAGSRAKGWGKTKTYSDTTQRVDDLFFEYSRLLRGLQPKTFIAENVSGLVKGVAKGYFLEILKELKACGYRVSARVLNAAWLGVAQSRQRLIFVGVREDLGLEPVHPKPLPYCYTIRDALPHLRSVVHDTSGERSTGEVIDRPCPTITVGGQQTAACHFKVEAEADITGTAIGREWDRMGRPGTQSEKYFQLVRPSLDKPCPTITATAGVTGAAGVTHPTERRKFSIAEVKALSGCPADFVLTGSYRQQWERLGRCVPPVLMSHIAAAVRDGILRRIKP